MSDFDDLLTNNAQYAENFPHAGMKGVAAAGVAVLHCMDSRVDPLPMLGLELGDAKVIRTPGGHLGDAALAGMQLAVQLLGCNRIMIIQHTKCAMASGDDAALVQRIRETTGADASASHFGADPNQEDHLRADVEVLRNDPLTSAAKIGGFIYDVDSGRLRQIC